MFNALSKLLIKKPALLALADAEIALMNAAQTKLLDMADQFDRAGEYRLHLKFMLLASEKADEISAARQRKAAVANRPALLVTLQGLLSA